MILESRTTPYTPEEREQKKQEREADMNEIEQLAAPLVEWLRRKGALMTEIRISYGRISTWDAGYGIPCPYNEV